MGTVSVSLPSDGQTIDAADYNTPINTIVTAVNGNLDSDNIAEGGVVPNSLVDGTGTSWAWQSFTPTNSGLTLGNGTEEARYTQIGKTVIFRYQLTFGSTTSISGTLLVGLPVTANAAYSNTNLSMGTAIYNDATGNDAIGSVISNSTTVVQPACHYTDTTAAREVAITSTTPHT